MKLKKFTTAFLILVMALQLLPIRQAAKYFLIDNVTVEEISNLNKGVAKNFRFLDEDHKCMFELDCLSHHFVFINNISLFHFAEMLPLFHAADIHTPPPNHV